MAFKRGEVYQVNLDPTVGDEIKKRRPAVIVSADLLNTPGNLVVVVPLTDSTGKTSKIHVLITSKEGGLKKESVANCFQIRSVSTNRLDEKIGNLSADTMQQIDDGLRWTLGLN